MFIQSIQFKLKYDKTVIYYITNFSMLQKLMFFESLRSFCLRRNDFYILLPTLH